MILRSFYEINVRNKILFIYEICHIHLLLNNFQEIISYEYLFVQSICLNCPYFVLYYVNSSLCSFLGLLACFRGLFVMFYGDLCMIRLSIHPS